MMAEQPTPGIGGRHREIHKTLKNQNPKLEPRTALREGINKVREIYKKDGLYKEIRPNLLEVIKKNKEKFPNLFDKNK
jgi:filamentous hemagglutinin